MGSDIFFLRVSVEKLWTFVDVAFSFYFWQPLMVSSFCLFQVLPFPLIWTLWFVSQKHWWLINWLTVITASYSFLICRDFPLYWRVSGVMVRGNDVEICSGGRGEVERGQWQLSHSNKHLPLWTDSQRRGVGRGGPLSPHSCHRPVTQEVILPPHLDWIIGFWSVRALARLLLQWVLETAQNSDVTPFSKYFS